MKPTRFVAPLFLLLAFALFPVRADEPRVVVAPSVGFLKTVAENPPTWLKQGIVDSKSFEGTVRFDRELTADELAEMEAMGLAFRRRSHDREPWDVDHIGPIYPVRIAWKGLDALTGHPRTVQVESEYLLNPLPPLNVTVPQTGAPEFIDHLYKELDLRPGEGIKIADIDSGMDVFHPSFFHADGGYYAWIDVNGDGELTFGTDACDLNGDGAAGPDETLRFHDVTMVNMYDWAGINLQELKDALQPNGDFDFGVDWIYVDTNGNGERDFGPDGGFDDSAPGFGEPVVLVDDVNENDRLDAIEKLVLLKSSKIRKAYVQEKEYVAGENLSELTSDVFPAESDGTPVSMHGTGVAGILAANSPRLNRFVGMAPYIDLYMIDSSKDGGNYGGGVDATLPKLIWAKEQAVDIVLFEFSSWGLTFMDGTSNLEKAIDQLYQKNKIMQVVPAGNLAESGKHMQTELPPGKTELGITLPENWEGYEYYPFETPVLIFSLYWEGNATDFELEVQVPELGGYVKVPATVYEPLALGGNMSIVSYTEKSMRGISHRMMYILDNGQKAIKTGTWKFRFNNVGGTKVPIHGFTNDTLTGWGRGVLFDKWESNATTICHPSTADSAMSVAAYGGEFGTPEELGKIRGYSSRGPRMDGFQAIDVAAPDDPYTPLARMKTGMMMGLLDIRASYTVFGGTSGAGPHVAGALALLMQLEPDLEPTQLFDRLVKQSVKEPFMGELPNAEYGYGKLNLYKSEFGQLPPGNLPPSATLKLYFRNGFYATLDASGSADPEAGPLQYRWDFDYDGVWDTKWMDKGTVEFGYPEVGLYTAKVAVRDDPGAIAFALTQLEVLDDYEPGKKPPPPPEDVVEQADVPGAGGDVDVHTPFLVEQPPTGGGGGGGCTWPAALLFLFAFALLRLRRSRS